MSNKEPQNDEVGGHGGPPYGDSEVEGFVGSAAPSISLRAVRLSNGVPTKKN